MQQRNYQREMDALIASLGVRPRLLLHSCCGPCSSACLERLAPHFDIDVFFYNPNILPAEEYPQITSVYSCFYNCRSVMTPTY